MDTKNAVRDKGYSPLRLASIYIGTVVGAGFASGQEVLQFFGFHGVNGIWGITAATVLFAAFGGVSFILGRRLNAVSHLEVVRASAGPWLGIAIDGIITFFLLGAFTAMVAGSGAVFWEQYHVPAMWGRLAMAAASVVTVLFGIEGVLKAISMIAPVLIGSVLAVSLVSLMRAPINFNWAEPAAAAVTYWPISALAYVSYNMVIAVAVLAPTGRFADERTLRKGALLGGLGLGLGALAIHAAILTQVPRVAQTEIPMLLLANRVLGPLAPLYSVILLAEVYTTAAGSLYGFAARVMNPAHGSFSWVVIGSGIVGLVGSLVGFSNLVARLYSAVGYAGFALLIVLLIGWFRYRETPWA